MRARILNNRWEYNGKTEVSNTIVLEPETTEEQAIAEQVIYEATTGIAPASVSVAQQVPAGMYASCAIIPATTKEPYRDMLITSAGDPPMPPIPSAGDLRYLGATMGTCTFCKLPILLSATVHTDFSSGAFEHIECYYANDPNSQRD